jgi:DNA primase
MTSVTALGLQVERISGGHELLLCPFHADTNPSAWFNPKKNLFYCAVCGTGMNIYQMARALNVEIELDGEENVEEYIKDYSMLSDPSGLNLGTAGYHPYVELRGIDAFTAGAFGLRFSSSGPEAVIFPVTSVYGSSCGSVHRYVNPAQMGTRYKKFGKMKPLWPLHFLERGRNAHLVVVVEGGWSAMRLTSVLNHDEVAVSTLGALANEGIADVVNGFPQVVFLYDDDMAGERACRKMRQIAPDRLAFTLEKAPDDMNEDELFELMGKVRGKFNAV